MNQRSSQANERPNQAVSELNDSEVAAVSGGLRLSGVLERIIDLVDKLARVPPRL